jgi:hypothetical protein
MKESLTTKSLIGLYARYILIVLLGIGNLYLIYLIFTPATIYPSYFILNFFYDASLKDSNLLFNIPGESFIGPRTIELNNSCIAGSAYYLLLILNFSISMPFLKRAYLIIYSLSVLLFLNIIRIIFFSFLFLNNFSYFDITHIFFWYFLSMFFVVIIWFSGVYFFNIKKIPFYSDFKLVIKSVRF